MSAWTYKTDDRNLERLFALARDKSASGRRELAQVMSDMFSVTSDTLSDRERALMGDILRQLIHEVETSVRRCLAEHLAKHKAVPKDLVVTLANDEIEVAHPILLQSEVLQDEELIEVIRHRTIQHQLTIAMRHRVSEQVTDALVETQDQSVITALINNHNAKISEKTMCYLVSESERLDSYQNPLLRRPDLTQDLAKRMYWWVSAALRKHIIQHFEIDPVELDDHIERTVEQVIDDRGDVVAEDAGSDLAGTLANEQPEDVATMINVLRGGEIMLFEKMMAQLTDLRLPLLRRIAYEPGGEALAILCKACKLSRAQFAEVFELTRSARPLNRAQGAESSDKVLALFDEMDLEAAEKVVRSWRRNPNYLKAIYELNKAPSSNEVA